MLPNFNSPMQTTITHHGCYGGVVKACYETCEEPVAFVAYSQVGNDFVITSFSVHPLASKKEAEAAGNEIDAVLELEALKHGVRQLLIVPPGKNTAEFVRDYQVKPFVSAMGVTNNPIAYLN